MIFKITSYTQIFELLFLIICNTTALDLKLAMLLKTLLLQRYGLFDIGIT